MGGVLGCTILLVTYLFHVFFLEKLVCFQMILFTVVYFNCYNFFIFVASFRLFLETGNDRHIKMTFTNVIFYT